MNKILIVDDDARNIFALTATLKSKGFTCVPASDGNEALSALSQDDSIGLVLLDIMMPQTDGYELIERIRNDMRFAGLALIAVTAQAMPGDREKCIEAGADDYISKPVDVEKMLALNSQHIN